MTEEQIKKRWIEMSIVALLPSLLSMLLLMIATSSANGGNVDDEAALLAFRAAISGRNSSALASWNGSTSFCRWEGVTCSRGRKPPRVVALSLPRLGLAGTLSPAIGNLTFLRELNLSHNLFRREIPPSIGRLRQLRTLALQDNALSGKFPANLSFCKSLLSLDLGDNRFHGRIPVDLGNTLTRLQRLLLTNNNFTGPVVSSLANLSSMLHLSLAFNQLGGPIPPGLGNINGLQFLDLSWNNLHGVLPLSLYNLSSLTIFHVNSNQLHGTIPPNIGDKFPSMQDFSLGDQFSGIIPASISNLTTLRALYLAGNRFSGYCPTLGRLQALKYLYLDDNRLEADDRAGWEFITSLTNCSGLLELVIGNNSFSGQLPSSIVNLSTTLQKLYLGSNRISGGIPLDIGNLVGLNVIEMANTFISGLIPESIGKLANLVVLGLYNTSLSGLIPSSLGNLSQLTTLYAYYGNLEGPIPASLGELKNLFVLDLSTNYRLNGSIPIEVLKLPALSWYLDLSYNSLSGSLPSEVGSLANLNQLILSGNQLSGNIPDSIENCIVLEWLLLDNNSFEGSIPQSLKNIKGLSKLNLTMNKLSGSIPDALGSIRMLQELYLAHNNLSGPIPAVLQNLTLLSSLDLSYNDLQGEMPNGGVLRNLTNLSIAGNNGLCGGMPQLHLPPCSMPSVGKNKKGQSKSLRIALEATGALLFLALVIALSRLMYKKLRHRQRSQFQTPVIEEQYRRVSYHALSNGTNGFSEDHLLGKGSYGMVYKCILHDEGTTVAIKVFNLEQSGSTRSFVAECEALRSVRHRCLLKIVTCCSSIDNEGREFKALVFEFMPNGSLDGWVHPKSSMPTLSNTLSLAQRLDIAVDIMDALDYLHNHCQPPIIHCDLKPSNILLAEDMSARVGDFGISRILPESASQNMQNSYSSVGVRGSIGYVAPEYGEGSSISTLGDVYSLGILLLEMFTGRSPTDDMFRDSLDLHKFSEAAVPDRILEIADPTIWVHRGANDSMTRSRIEECLISVIGLGLSCSKQQPRERTPIQDAVMEMHAIRDAYFMFAGRFADSGTGKKNGSHISAVI